MKFNITVLLLCFSLLVKGQSTTLVISQVYGGGGNTGAPYNADFVVLHNISNTSQSLSGLSFQYASATATGTWSGVFPLPSATIPAGGYYLIQVSATGANGAALPTPDAVASPAIAMSATAGRVALVNGTTALSGCPTTNIIDLVGFGTTATCFEGTGPAAAPSNSTATIRNNNGCAETNNNANDFTAGAPNPQNSATTAVNCTSATPLITVTPLADFGNVCTGTTAGPNSFTITGSNLTSANVTVGPLSGFAFATTSGGTYAANLSLTQAGGSYSQDIFVQFSPTAVQSYNGNIPVAGGGVSAAVDVAASGSGVGASLPVVSVAAATSVTASSATLPATITNTGCSVISAYGIEYSTTAGFPNGSGTQVVGTNLSGAAFSVALSGLNASTTYYYKAYATNGTGTGYSAEQSFTTGSGTPVTGVVLSQVYGGGGGSTGTYKNDYVELHNNTGSTISLTGLSLQYGSTTGNFGSSTSNIYAFPSGASIPAGGYLLVQLGSTGTGGIDLPVTPDYTSGNLNMSGTSGKVALVNQTTGLGCGATATPCTLPNPLIVDLVSYGASNNGEGGTTVNNGTALTSTQGAVRKNNGCQDNDDNNGDFDVITAPVPRNSGSPAFFCGGAPPPSLSISSPLSAFGNVCINTSAGPNSFTISGTNLTTADVTVATLAGYTYSTTSGGTYTSSLTLTQPGGSFSQPIFVRFEPTAVQSYNGNIAVAGGGVTTPVNVAASGAGVNTLPTVSSGSATGITTTGATVAGTISANGCSAVTAYGIEYSTTAGFPNGSGTAVPSSNISGGNFSSALSGLTPATTYYYHAYATNGGGTAYGAEQSFTTDAAIPALSAGTLTAFGDVCINTTAGPNSFTVSGVNLTTSDVTVGPLSGYQFATSAGGPYSASLSLTQGGGSFSQTVFVQFTPVAVQSYSGDIPVGGGGATPINVVASGNGVNTLATVATGSASGITTTGATLAGTISANGCSAVAAYGIEYSTTAGFPNGTGTQVASSNISGGNFSSAVTGLPPGTLYYYKAYATNNGGTAYGSEQSFATLSLSPTLSATALNGFGTVCVNTTAGPNSFTINGSALNTTNVTVGPLAGYTFATVAGGPYTASLSLTQPGGTYSQTVFVNFTPTAVQSFNGDIPVSGGGAAAVNVPVTGSGINTAPSVTTGAATGITSVSATAAGSVPATGCSAISAYGIEYSTTAGFPNGSGTQVPASNLSGGNFSANLTGLTPSTIYYYKAYATNGGGTTWGAEQSFTTATPLLTVSALTGFGNVCLNTTAGPNSFTITGTLLTTANISVGPLAGYTFSTTSGGTYSASLTLTQPGGAYSQAIFVRFTPVAVQSYNGNIPVTGGGAAATSVAVTGAGINTAPAVSTGAASAVTFNSATAAGSVPATGCSPVTAYGIEYSTVNGFPNGTGTQVTASNLSAGNFSASLTGLAANTIYYYKAYATNGGGTTYGTQQSFTTLPVPISLTATALAPFGNQCINTSSTPNSFTINGSFLTSAPISVGPLAGYAFATSAGGVYSPSLMLTQPGGTYTQTVFVQFTPPGVQAYNGNIPVSGGGFATPVQVAASGTGVNTLATVITGAAASLTTFSATLAGTVAANGCSSVTEYGVEYSGINGFVNGSGTRVPATAITGGNFTVPLNGLVQGTTYYFKAYAINSGGVSYGLQQSFTLPSIRDQFVIYPAPAMRGQTVRVSRPATAPGYYALQFINGAGQLAFQYNLHLQAGFINQAIPVPGQLTPGIYRVLLVSQERIIDSRSLHIF